MIQTAAIEHLFSQASSGCEAAGCMQTAYATDFGNLTGQVPHLSVYSWNAVGGPEGEPLGFALLLERVLGNAAAQCACITRSCDGLRCIIVLFTASNPARLTSLDVDYWGARRRHHDLHHHHDPTALPVTLAGLGGQHTSAPSYFTADHTGV